MTTEQPRTYKYQLTAEEFRFAFTATAEEFEPRKEEMRGKGVERLMGAEVRERSGLVRNLDDDRVFTLIAETEIIAEPNQSITLQNIQAPVPGLVLWKSNAPSIELISCTLAGIENDQIQNDATSFHFFESTTGDFSIGQSTTGDFSIRQSTTGDFSILEQSTTGYFSIGQSTTGDFSSLEQSTTGNFSIGQSTTGDFFISSSEVANFGADGLFSSFNLTKATIAQFRLSNCKLPELRIASGCRMECYVAHSSINLIDLQHLTLSRESVVSFFDCEVYACLMEEFAVLGNLFFRQVTPLPQRINWYDLKTKLGDEPVEDQAKTAYNVRKTILESHIEKYQEHLKRLTGLEKDDLKITEPTFRIAQSSLGKTDFTDCDLRGFRFEFNNAKITEVFMSGGRVPEDKIVIYSKNNDEEKNLLRREEQKVSVYNQLKKIFDGQGDIYLSTHFQAKTAEHQEKVLTLSRKEERKAGGEFFSTTFWDIITFRLNGFSNRHGESWGRAFLFTAGVAGLFYLLFLLSIGRLLKSTAFDWELAGKYFTYLDPTHKIDFIAHANLNFVSYLTDFLSRIFVGYGIYQFISAFRKHGRK